MDVKTDKPYGTLVWGLWDRIDVMKLVLNNGSLTFYLNGPNPEHSLKVKVISEESSTIKFHLRTMYLAIIYFVGRSFRLCKALWNLDLLLDLLAC